MGGYKNKRRRNFKKHLLADEDAIIRIVRENRGLAVRIRNWLDSLLYRLAATRRVSDAFVRRAVSVRALDDVENVTGRVRQRTGEAMARANAAISTRAEDAASETRRERLRQARERLAVGEMSCQGR